MAVAGCGVDSSGNAIDAMSGSTFAGARGDDVFFQNYQLKNGWIVDSVVFTQGATENANSYVAASSPGTNSPYVDVHWWVTGTGICVENIGCSNPPPSYTAYELSIFIRGPKGVPYQ